MKPKLPFFKVKSNWDNDIFSAVSQNPRQIIDLGISLQEEKMEKGRSSSLHRAVLQHEQLLRETICKLNEN